jgi:hypothetical protein
MIELIISILALICSIIALFLAYKRKNKTEIIEKTVTEVINGPIENPFIYDKNINAYTLMGDLKVNGYISALNKEQES